MQQQQKLWLFFLSLGKATVIKDNNNNIVITYQLVLQINGKKYMRRLKMTICKYIFARLWEAAVDTSFSSLCTVPASSFSINAAVAFSPWSLNVIISSIIEKEEAGTVQREEKEVSTAASHNLAKIYTCKLSFLVGTYISFHWFVVLCGRWLQYWYYLLWPFLFPKIEKIITTFVVSAKIYG